MLSDLLASVAEGGRVLVSEDSYLLARVQMDGRELLAEVSRGDSGGISPGDWPRIPGLLRPDSEIHPGDDPATRILLFSIPEDGELLLERLSRVGKLSEEEAVSLGIQILEALKALHAEGSRIGYIGPETVMLDSDGRPLLVAGARGVPDSPFSPPEAVGKCPEDPRSDIFALGLLMFRSIAGSDERQRQVDAWNELSEPLLSLLEQMVQPDTGSRYPNFTALSAGIRNLRSAPPGEGGGEWVTHSSRKKQRRLKPIWYVVFTIAAAVIAFLAIILPNSGDPGVEDTILPDTLQQVTVDTVIPQLTDTLITEVISAPDIESLTFDPVIWISNGTGQPGVASEFREGPAASYSSVFKCTASPRRISLLLLRRDDPTLQSRFLEVAEELTAADSTILTAQVDISILLGADLVNDLIPAGAITYPPVPAGTLYVDIANHGVSQVFGGAGAATWTRSILNGGCLTLDGESWFISVVDFRDGDLYNAELGIPTTLDSTVFMYREGSELLRSAERELRFALLEDSTLTHSSGSLPSPPDIWVLLGSQ